MNAMKRSTLKSAGLIGMSLALPVLAAPLQDRRAMKPVELMVTLEAKPESDAALHNILQQVRQDLPKVEGCLGVRLFKAVGDAPVYTLIEQWESVALHKANLDRVIASGDWARIAMHLARDPISAYYTEV